jgi:hypothetical protein
MVDGAWTRAMRHRPTWWRPAWESSALTLLAEKKVALAEEDVVLEGSGLLVAKGAAISRANTAQAMNHHHPRLVAAPPGCMSVLDGPVVVAVAGSVRA